MQQLITARQVLIGPAGQRIDDGAVLIDDDTIIAVGTRAHLESKAPAEVQRRDFPQHTMLPGLINCHVHLAFDASPDPVTTLNNTTDDDLFQAMSDRAQQALRSGVTTLRDLGDRNGLAIRLRESIDRGDLAGPRILASGPPLTIPKGHCWFFGGEVADKDDIRARVRANAALGADVIKVMASGGQLTPNSPPMWASQFSTDELCLVVEEAAAAGLPVAAHAHGTEAIVSAVEAGAATIEHCSWLTSGGYDARDDIARKMAENGTYACVAWPPRWREFMARIGEERAEQMRLRFQWLDKLGVRLIPGTDAGLRNSTFDGFASSLQLYEYVGFSADRVIEMATTTSAHALGRGKETGQLVPGYSADLLVVAGDPLVSLDALQQPTLVLAQGREAVLSDE